MWKRKYAGTNGQNDNFGSNWHLLVAWNHVVVIALLPFCHVHLLRQSPCWLASYCQGTRDKQGEMHGMIKLSYVAAH
jgi:hypothetical protein